MKIIDPGHHYEAEVLDDPLFNNQDIVFVKRFRGNKNHAGTINQELIRIMIHRMKVLDKEIYWEGNAQIIHHLRMALVLHEARALIRKVEKKELNPEEIKFSKKDGHFIWKT
jgi:hypothetical protein